MSEIDISWIPTPEEWAEHSVRYRSFCSDCLRWLKEIAGRQGVSLEEMVGGVEPGHQHEYLMKILPEIGLTMWDLFHITARISEERRLNTTCILLGHVTGSHTLTEKG